MNEVGHDIYKAMIKVLLEFFTKMGFTIVIAFFVILLISSLYFLSKSRRSQHQKLPPGSLGIPYVGDSFGLLHAMWSNTDDQWLARRVNKHGPISKLTLFGAPTIFVTGQAANKFVFTHEAVTPQQTSSTTRLIGRRNMLELVGEDHRRVRGAVGQFLRPERLKKYVPNMDWEVRDHLETNWMGHRTVKVISSL